jgi:UDP-2,3-diacylglucosamine pyrophosphatase LpxH
LGHADCRTDYLLDFLHKLRCETLYLVGDIVDLQAIALGSRWSKQHAAVVGQILAMASNGVRVVYLPGNHDAALRGLVGQRVCGIEVARWAEHLAADGRRYRVSHGDEFDPEDIGSDWLIWIGEYAHRGMCWLNRGVNGVRKQLALPYLPLGIIAKSRIAAASAYIRRYEERVLQQAEAEGFDGHICGHIHFGNLRSDGATVYMNDGDWVEHCTCLIEDAQGGFELLHWAERCTRIARLEPRSAPSVQGTLELHAADHAPALPQRRAA